jgi:multisubunit Na+/H+ antiporter MnhB subunit
LPNLLRLSKTKISKQKRAEKNITMAQKPYKTKRRLIPIAISLLLITIQTGLVIAATDADFEEILAPLTVIYDLIKYAATIVAGLVMLFAGVTYIASGSDPGKREKAKNMVMYVIVGLMVIWAAPFVVNLILG